jgi:hypothetical protein
MVPGMAMTMLGRAAAPWRSNDDAVSEVSPQGNWKMPSEPCRSGSGLGLSRMSGSSVIRLLRRGGRCVTGRGGFCDVVVVVFVFEEEEGVVRVIGSAGGAAEAQAGRQRPDVERLVVALYGLRQRSALSIRRGASSVRFAGRTESPGSGASISAAPVLVFDPGAQSKLVDAAGSVDAGFQSEGAWRDQFSVATLAGRLGTGGTSSSDWSESESGGVGLASWALARCCRRLTSPVVLLLRRS